MYLVLRRHFSHLLLFLRMDSTEACVSADGRIDESQLTQALSTPLTDHPSAMFARGQYSRDQSVSKSPSRHRRRRKIEKEEWGDETAGNSNTTDLNK